MTKLPKGVTVTPKGRYLARFCKDAKIIHAGVYDTVEEAVDARRAALLSHATMSMTAAPVTEQEQAIQDIPAVVPETATTKPQAAPQRDSPASWPPQPPGHCPKCGSALWAPCSGGGMVCNQCGLQKLEVIPGPGLSRSEYQAGGWGRRRCG